MSEYVSALGGAAVTADAMTVRDAGCRGMVLLKADLADDRIGAALSARCGADLPEQGGSAWAGAFGILWMAPDEVLVLMPRDQAASFVNDIAADLSGMHHLVVDVSDARAMIEVEGPGLRDTLAKLTPADMSPAALPPGRVRRTRMSQVAAAIWLRDEATGYVICFRSVARYAFDVLVDAARGGRVGFLG